MAYINASKPKFVECYIIKILSYGEGKGVARTDINKYIG